jgi:ABC-type lipoprotein export system ATPase subunit
MDDMDAAAARRLVEVGLGDRQHHTPSQLSGGQQQRVAIARALVTDPQLILADEPTGALDTQTSKEIMELFTQLHRNGMTIIMVTHEPEIAAYAERLLRFRDGLLVDDVRQTPKVMA